MPILKVKSQLAAKIESVEGTAEALAAANALRCTNPDWKANVEMHEREIVASDMSPFASLSGKRSGNISFGVEIKGSGAAGTAPEWGDLMKACGLSETIVASTSVTYKPASDSIPSMTLAAYKDGVIGKIWGARGKVSLEAEVGKPGMLNFDFLGADFDFDDVALLTGMSYDSGQPPVFLSASLSIDSYAFLISKISIDLGNVVSLREDVNKSSGHLSALITKRRPVGSFDPELISKATYDIFSKWKSGAEGALTLTLGSTAGNICTITAPKVRYKELSLSDREDRHTLDVGFELNRNAGNDELSIALT